MDNGCCCKPRVTCPTPPGICLVCLVTEQKPVGNSFRRTSFSVSLDQISLEKAALSYHFHRTTKHVQMAYMPTSSTFCTEESVETAHLAGSLEHADLITVLAASQRNHVDFVPIIWQEALGSLGKGGTANVSQALLNLQTSFAFKRTSEYRAVQFGDRQKGPAEILALEISILKHPPIQKHPNVVDLEGVCWEITDKNDVYPVLLFEKAEQGDLLSFVPSLYGESVSFGVKLGLCIDIVHGVQALHNASKFLFFPALPL